jgi:hypothetical protein
MWILLLIGLVCLLLVIGAFTQIGAFKFAAKSTVVLGASAFVIFLCFAAYVLMGPMFKQQAQSLSTGYGSGSSYTPPAQQANNVPKTLSLEEMRKIQQDKALAAYKASQVAAEEEKSNFQIKWGYSDTMLKDLSWEVFETAQGRWIKTLNNEQKTVSPTNYCFIHNSRGCSFYGNDSNGMIILAKDEADALKTFINTKSDDLVRLIASNYK